MANHKKPKHLKKEPVCIKLPHWLKVWLQGQENQSVLIEQAIIKQHGLIIGKVEE